MSETLSRPTPVRLLLHGVVALMTIFQVGLSGIFMYYALRQTMDGRISPSPLWLIMIIAILVVDAFLIRWLFRMADGLGTLIEPDDEGEPG